MDKNTHILIVDDYKTMRRIIRSLLRQLDFKNIEEAEDASSAFGRLVEGDYELVIADYNMEPETGLWLLKKVRAEKKLAGLPFIMIIAETRSGVTKAIKEAGADAIVFKPFSVATLKGKITTALRPDGD